MSQESRKLEEWRLLKYIHADSGEATIQGVTRVTLTGSGGDPEGALVVRHILLGPRPFTESRIPLGTTETNLVSKSDTCILLFCFVLFVSFSEILAWKFFFLSVVKFTS